ncbi:DUF3365 domain-containing protein [Maribacter sp.]|uniref:Tll0287-like domain-containing protein n=1 Tax=Maribacter sp. TaxID=1897614 RepID=UPI0025C6BEC2|nr:DUF3365 domain-containing protein [Maribacter sp.]
MKFLYLSLVLLFLTNCKDAKKSEYIATEDKEDSSKNISSEQHPGKKLMETECYICHNPKASESSRIAPPMIAIKKHYINSNTSKEEFRKSMVNWIENPSIKNSKMPGALKRFGVMPYQPYPIETIEQIADYMFDNTIEQPKWFKEHYKQGHGKGHGKGNNKGMGRKNRNSPNSEIDYADMGLKYALSTKAQLGKNLMRTIKEKGTVGAVEFCNIKAITLTDSISVINNALIKRVSDKPRNPKNKANATELGHINTFKKLVSEEKEINPIVEKVNKKIHFYYPIKTNSMCLQCHGKSLKNIEIATMATLKVLYPNDKAIDYDVNEVRGIWSISFDEKSIAVE